jgi:hypothetical protein
VVGCRKGAPAHGRQRRRRDEGLDDRDRRADQCAVSRRCQPGEQARQITDVLWKAAESGFSGPAFIFSIRDIDTADQDKEQDNFGALLTSDWQPKVAAGVLAR